MNLTHGSTIIRIRSNNDVNVLNNALESLVQLFRVQLQFQQSPVHLVHEQNGLDTFGDGLPEYGLGLDTHP